MLRGLWHLTWLEIKIFMREPMGATGTLVFPVVLYLALGRALGGRTAARPLNMLSFVRVGLPVLAAVLIALGAVSSLVTIIAIYREGGILRRLRATPLRPQTILTAHVVVKLLLSALSLVLMMLAGKRYVPVNAPAPVLGFTIALLISTWSILSVGFVIASIVPTARFTQPVAAAILYPMIAVSGLFFPVQGLPPVLRAVARVTPLTYAVSLMEGIWKGESWLAHWNDVVGLVIVFAVCTAVSAKIFRWE